MGATVTQFENGALTESNDRLNYTSTLFGEATGNKALEYEVGPTWMQKSSAYTATKMPQFSR